MAVPEAALDLNYRFVVAQDNIWTSRKLSDVQAKPKTEAM